jgi:RNA polymerase sigma-70 factor (ECF subfamily)
MFNDRASALILEPFHRTRAIPSIKELWCPQEMDANGTDFDDDGQSLEQMMAGEERGFVALYRKYHAPVYRFSLQIGGNRPIAEELTQETFLALIRAPRKYQADRGPLLLYLLGIARNLAWKNGRKSKVYTALEGDQELPVFQPDLASDLARKERVIRVRRAVISLPPKYREVIVLCCLQELSYDATAAVVGCSVGTVRSRMHRAKQLLLRKLSEARSTDATEGQSSFFRYQRGLDYDL